MIVLKSGKYQKKKNNIKMKHSLGGNFARMKNKVKIKKKQCSVVVGVRMCCSCCG
jgi:hypothetical protein